MSTFVIRIDKKIRNNFERALQHQLWDTKNDLKKTPMLTGDTLYFWITGTGPGSGLVGRATATTDLLPGPGDKPGDPSYPWVDEDTSEYGRRVHFDSISRIVTPPGLRWSDIPGVPQGQQAVVALPEESAQWLDGFVQGRMVPQVSLTDAAAAGQPPIDEQVPLSALEEDLRRYVDRQIAARQGQGNFRADLLYAYEQRCAITGTAVETVLDAAHISPYRGNHTNLRENGILLRTDLHTLFDRHLITIVDGKVAVSPALEGTAYGEYAGRAVAEPIDGRGPSEEYLAAHRDRCEWLRAEAAGDEDEADLQA